MIESDVSKALTELGYTKQWLGSGVLTTEILLKQYQIFETGEDRNTEHYRYGAFRQYLSARKTLTDSELTNYLQLILAEKDFVMAESAAKDLFLYVELTAEQTKKVGQAMDMIGAEWFNKVMLRQQLVRELENEGLSEALFKKCLAEGDSVVQELVLSLSDAQQLAELAAKAINKRLRSLAATKLKHQKKTRFPSA
jgi:hypothetical protein